MAHLTHKQIDRFLAGLDAAALTESRSGVERECLRVNADGALATTPHPAALGSALTHPSITTDFSEALVEFVTPPCDRPWQVVQYLCDLHKYSHDRISDERFWPLSMPCAVESAADIPLARYGNSNVGTMKTTYRRGLGYRYGRVMQTIAGLHFNFSACDDYWRAYREFHGDDRPLQEFKSAGYFALVRNFRRYAWLILYLFGASPAVCKSFLQHREHRLEKFDDETFYLPGATSLRMSNLGYTSDAQAHLNISLNSLDEYVAGLARAIETPYPAYQEMGVHVDGEWRQLSANILQIANEFYSVVRPKRTTHSGEAPTRALRDRGVEYVEIRALDLSPYDPVGVSQGQIRFLECFLYFCALTCHSVIGAREQVALDRNQADVARRGRDPDLKLTSPDGQRSLSDWALAIFDTLELIAGHLDRAYGDGGYSQAVAGFRGSVRDPQRTPSALLLNDMRERRLSHSHYGCELANRHKDYFRELAPLGAKTLAAFEQAARDSFAEQAAVEASDKVDFATYLDTYFQQV